MALFYPVYTIAPPLPASFTTEKLRLGLHKPGNLVLDFLIRQPCQQLALLLAEVYEIIVSIFLSICGVRPIDLSYIAGVVLTITGENLGLCSSCLADHDWRGWVVLLHRGVRASKERSVKCIESAYVLNFPHSYAAGIQLHPGRDGGPEKHRSRDGGSHLVALLVSPVWHSRNRTSLRPLVNAYLPDMVMSCMREDSSSRSCHLQFRFTKLLIRRRVNIIPLRAQTPVLCSAGH
jgi:hypothetical protein